MKRNSRGVVMELLYCIRVSLTHVSNGYNHSQQGEEDCNVWLATTALYRNLQVPRQSMHNDMPCCGAYGKSF
jgi:hypothetical protein